MARKKKNEVSDEEAENVIDSPEVETQPEPIAKKSSDSGLDYKKHPKFDKFNSKDQGAE
jgi:hypothetical protein